MRRFTYRGDLMTRGLPAAYQTAHPASQSGHRISSALGVVLMLSPAQKTRVCPMRVAGKTGRLSIGRRYHSATSSPAPGALLESVGQPPNLLGGWAPKPLRHSFPKLACDWFAPCERKIATMAKLKDRLGK